MKQLIACKVLLFRFHMLPALLLCICISFPLGCAEKMSYPVEYYSPAEFLLGPEDVLSVTVWKNQDLSRQVVVRPDGQISMPLVGDIQASGLTANGLAKRITERLTEFMASPTVSVHVVEVNSYFIYVQGEVAKPGKYPLKSYATVLQGVSLAGGFSQYASRSRMQVLRKIENGHDGSREIRIPVNYDDLLSGKGNPGNFILRSGDTIVVP